MIAIHVKYLGPTTTKGARIKAYNADGLSIVRSRNCNLDILDQYKEVAKEFVGKSFPDEKCKLYGAYTREGMVFVLQDRTYEVELD